MKLNFDKDGYPEIPHIHLATPGKKLITTLNGIRPDTVSLNMRLNNTWELSFTVDRCLSIHGTLTESSGYHLLDEKMKLYVDQIGWFILKTPSVSNDGKVETKKITAESAEIEWVDKSLKGFKINCGTTDSMEMLAPDNVEIIGGVEFPIHQIVFCDKEHPELSLLHLAMKAAGLTGWEVGYVDEIPQIYTSYLDGQPVEKVVRLKDEIGTFDIDSSGLYSFFTQDLSQFFQCIFLFDIQNYRINVYRAEHLGKDTSVTISFRNFQNSNEITCSNPDDICTCCYVSGGDDLGIEQVNFGWNYIEDKSYFLNTRYLSPELIAKYNEWKSYTESRRFEYIDLTRSYNDQLTVLSELESRVPLDDCSANWDEFGDEELHKAFDKYSAEKAGYESFYTDEENNFDEAKLAASSDADIYYQIRDVILPSIQIEMENRQLPTSAGRLDYVDSYLTDWNLYGTEELSVKLEMYQNQKQTCEAGHYDIPYAEYDALSNAPDNVEASAQYPVHTRDMHEQMHARYLDAVMQLDPDISGSCAEAYAQRSLEYADAERILEQIFEERATLVEKVTKETWNMEGVEPFTEDELAELSRLDSFTDYVNDNMFLTTGDDSITALDERLRLLDAAKADLETYCRPQYQYDTTLDSFLASCGFRQASQSLELGDFLYLEAQNDYFVKLRCVSLSYNPIRPGDSVSLGFSNMIKSASRRYDTTYLLNLGGYSGRNQISGTPGVSLQSDSGLSLTPELMKRLFSSSQYTNSVESAINRHFQSLIGQLVVAQGLEAEMMKAVNVSAENGFFEYLQAALIAADKIVAGSGQFKELAALAASIDTLLSGTVSTELAHIIHLTAQNVSIDEAVIRDLIASQITVSMLRAGNITLSDEMQILSENGCMVMDGETLQIKGLDSNGESYVAIQLGYSAAGTPALILNDENGAVMLDSQGLHEAIVPDGLIKSGMIADGQIQKEHLAFRVAEADENGNINASRVLINGNGLDAEFTTLQTSLMTEMSGVKTQVDANAKAISDEVWRDTLLDVTDAEGNTVKQSMESLLVKHETDLSGLTSTVQNVQTEVEQKADNSTVTLLSGQVSEAIQNASLFEQTVKSTYAEKTEFNSLTDAVSGLSENLAANYTTTSELETKLSQTSENILLEADSRIDADVAEARAALELTANQIAQRVQDNEDNISSLTTQADGISASMQTAQDDISALQLRAGAIEASVTDADGKAASALATAEALQTNVQNNYYQKDDVDSRFSAVESDFEQRADSIESVVRLKKDTKTCNVRYIRDWINSMDSSIGNRWVNCQVWNGDQNYAEHLVPAGFSGLNDPLPSDVTNGFYYTSSDTLKFTDSDTPFQERYASVEGTGWQCLQLDLGEIKQADYITVWHYFAEECMYHHKLQISMDGAVWFTVFDSDIAGTYPELAEGQTYVLNDRFMTASVSSILQDCQGIRQLVTTNENLIGNWNNIVKGLQSDLKDTQTSLGDIAGYRTSMTSDVSSLHGQLSEISANLTEVKSTVQAFDGNYATKSEVAETADAFKVTFAQIGLRAADSWPYEETNFTVSKNGAVVKNSQGQEIHMNVDGLYGKYNNETIFKVTQNLTVTRRLQSEDGIDCLTIKLVPQTYTAPNGKHYGALMHVKSGGTS